MAGNFNNGNNNNRPRRMSYTFATAFSGEKTGTEYQMVKIGFYDEKLTLDFNKGVAGSNSKMTSSFVKIDYELACILTGLLARGYSQRDACLLGMYLHGLAGDLAAKELGKESLIASDIINYLPQAFQRLND